MKSQVFFIFVAIFCLVACEQTEPKVKTKTHFSVSSSQYVSFSSGNLQYQASTNSWRFADNQYDVIGEDNVNVSESYDGWVDLFGWGTSGYNGRMPYMTSEKDLVYTETAAIAGTNYDWGIYNKILNDERSVGVWRALSADEWYYLISERKDANKLNAWSEVNGVVGLIILPDDCVLPNDVKFESVSNYGEDFEMVNIYSLEEWAKLEGVGAIFLPAAGQSIDKYVGRVNRTCFYWSSSFGAFDGTAGYFSCDTFGPYPFDDAASAPYHNAFAVRLVRDVE